MLRPMGRNWTLTLPLAPLFMGLCFAGACGGGEPEDLSTEQLSMVINGRRPQLQECYETALADNPSRKEVRMHAAIHIKPSGEVYKVEIDEGGALPGMVKCLEQAIVGWKFPTVPDETHASLPLIFRPESTDGKPSGSTGAATE